MAYRCAFPWLEPTSRFPAFRGLACALANSGRSRVSPLPGWYRCGERNSVPGMPNSANRCGGVSLHIFVAKHDEVFTLAPQCDPAQNVVLPRPELAIKFSCDEPGHKIVHRIVVRYIPRLHVMVIERDRHIARVAHHINHSRIMRLKGFMALQHARTRKLPQEPVPVEVDFGNPRLDVGESDRIILIQKISKKKASPGVARPGIRDQEDIIGIDSNSPSSDLAPGENTSHLHEGPEHPLKISLIP